MAVEMAEQYGIIMGITTCGEALTQVRFEPLDAALVLSSALCFYIGLAFALGR